MTGPTPGGADRLYALLPGVYRRRDAERGEPLRALLAVIQEQADLIAAGLGQLYEDWFIETCQDWVAPYLGDLVGYRLLPGADEALSAGDGNAHRLLAALAGRRDVAHTVASRRRKGTLALLEDLAADVAGWPARAVEFRRLTGVTQAVRLHGRDPRADRRRLRRGRIADLRAGEALDRVDGPFDQLAHTVDVRGRPSIPGVGLHVWRLRPHPITHGPAFCADRARTHFTFSILGNDTPLITRPVPEPGRHHIADETNVPAFIRRRAFAERTAHYYGPGKSLCVYLEGAAPVPLAAVLAADLTGWAYRPPPGRVAVDPVLGRIAFPPRGAPDTGVWVDYHHGFADDLGGGEYPRPLPEPPPGAHYTVGQGPENGFHQIMAAVAHWQAAKAADPARREAVIELTDSGAYQEQIEIPLEPGDRLTLRAAEGARPVLRMLDWYSNRPDSLRINGPRPDACEGPPPGIVFDGLLITGRGVRVTGRVGQFLLRHCTLVPGWSLGEHCQPEHGAEASVELSGTPACLQSERSILGTILVDADEARREPNQIWLSDTIIDAAGEGLAAVTGPGGRHAHAQFSARRTTVFGDVLTHAVGLVENSLLNGQLLVARRQTGRVRFCWLHPASRTPARFHCRSQPAPRYTSTRYGTPGYAQLAAGCPEEIRRGAEDASEPGAFHDLFQPQRADALALRLAEYTPAGCDAGLVIVT